MYGTRLVPISIPAKRPTTMGTVLVRVLVLLRYSYSYRSSFIHTRTRTVTAVVFNSTSTVRYEYGSCKNYRAVRVQYGTRTRTVRVLVSLLVSLLDASILPKFLVYVIWNDTEKISSARWSEARVAHLVYTIGLFCTTFYISPTKKSFAHAHA